jgi:predicted aspartyl protease
VWISLLCLALTAGIPAAAASADRDASVPSLDDLRARMKTAQGTPLTNDVETVVTTAADGTSSTSTTYRRGADYRTVDDGGQRGVVGGEHWFQNANGLTVIDIPPEGDREATSPAVTVTRVTSPAAYCITTDDRHGGITREYVDPATFLVTRVEESTPAGTATTTYTRYATVGTQTFASEWTRDDRHELRVEHVTKRIDVARTVTAQDVAEPPTERNLVDFPSSAPVTIPVTFVKNAIYVHAKVNGHPGNFALDTGASGIVLDRTFARQSGLTLTDREVNVANARAAQEFSVRVPSIEVGAVAMHDIVASALDFSNFNETGGVHLDGLLGFDFLATEAVTIDYEHATVTLTPSEAYHPPAKRDTLALDIKLGSLTPEVPLTIEGHTSDRFLLDTGADSGVLIFDSFVRRHHGIGSHVGTSTIAGAGGDVTVYVVRLSSFQIANVKVVDFGALETASATTYADAGDGLLGQDFLQMFTIDLDYPNGAIYLTPNGRGHEVGLP